MAQRDTVNSLRGKLERCEKQRDEVTSLLCLLCNHLCDTGKGLPDEVARWFGEHLKADERRVRLALEKAGVSLDDIGDRTVLARLLGEERGE